MRKFLPILLAAIGLLILCDTAHAGDRRRLFHGRAAAAVHHAHPPLHARARYTQ
jgi:hypothetical protein